MGSKRESVASRDKPQSLMKAGAKETFRHRYTLVINVMRTFSQKRSLAAYKMFKVVVEANPKRFDFGALFKQTLQVFCIDQKQVEVQALPPCTFGTVATDDRSELFPSDLAWDHGRIDWVLGGMV